MKIVCNKSDLVKGVNIVSKAVPSKTTIWNLASRQKLQVRSLIVV